MTSAPSVAAMVGTYEDRQCRYHPILRLNPRSFGEDGEKRDGRPQERIEPAGDMMVELVMNWQKKHQGNLPARIVLYRDGLSESQFRMAIQKEIADVKQKLDFHCGKAQKPRPALLVICTIKRHHTRFFGQNKSGTIHDNAGNPSPCVTNYGYVKQG